MGVRDPLMLILWAFPYFCPPGFLNGMGRRITVQQHRRSFVTSFSQFVCFTDVAGLFIWLDTTWWQKVWFREQGQRTERFSKSKVTIKRNTFNDFIKALMFLNVHKTRNKVMVWKKIYSLICLMCDTTQENRIKHSVSLFNPTPRGLNLPRQPF